MSCPVAWHDIVEHYCRRSATPHRQHVCPCGAQRLDELPEPEPVEVEP